MKRVVLLSVALGGMVSAGCLEIHIHPTFVVPAGAPGSPAVPTYATSQEPLGLRANPYDAVPVMPARPNWQMRPIDTAWPPPPTSGSAPVEGPKLRNIAGCDPPYTVTSTGFRRIKLECLE